MNPYVFAGITTHTLLAHTYLPTYHLSTYLSAMGGAFQAKLVGQNEADWRELLSLQYV